MKSKDLRYYFACLLFLLKFSDVMTGRYFAQFEFRCKNERFISSLSMCNGVDDCGDNSDEGAICNCSKEETFVCAPIIFRPDSETCIHNKYRCDGVSDCYLEDDEQDCPCRGFKCHNEICLPSYNSVCDGINDCGDNSDELDCGK